jgi:hypothetical protein
MATWLAQPLEAAAGAGDGSCRCQPVQQVVTALQHHQRQQVSGHLLK